jgi:hypothetical protein
MIVVCELQHIAGIGRVSMRKGCVPREAIEQTLLESRGNVSRSRTTLLFSLWVTLCINCVIVGGLAKRYQTGIF